MSLPTVEETADSETGTESKGVGRPVGWQAHSDGRAQPRMKLSHLGNSQSCFKRSRRAVSLSSDTKNTAGWFRAKSRSLSA